MSLFQNTQKITRAEVVGITDRGNPTWRVYLADGENFLTEPDGQINDRVDRFVGKVTLITLKHGRIVNLYIA